MSIHLPAIERRLRQARYVPQLVAGGAHHRWVHVESGHVITVPHHGRSTTFPRRVLERIEREIQEAAGAACVSS